MKKPELKNSGFFYAPKKFPPKGTCFLFRYAVHIGKGSRYLFADALWRTSFGAFWKTTNPLEAVGNAAGQAGVSKAGGSGRI